MSADYENNDLQSGDAGADGGAGEGAPDFGAGGGGENTDFVVSEPKKQLNMTTLALFGLVAAGGLTLYLMRGGPASANAASAAHTATVEQFLNGGPGNIQQMQRMLRETQQVVDQFLTYPSVTQIPLRSLQTNPFRQIAGSQDDPTAAEAEAQRKKEEQRLAIKAKADDLQAGLQLVIARGTRSSCMINNTVYKVGQQIDGGFVVDGITSSGVVLHNGEYKFELKMQR